MSSCPNSHTSTIPTAETDIVILLSIDLFCNAMNLVTKKDNSLTFNKLSFDFRDPGGIRTHDPQLRRLLLYPAELPDQTHIFFRFNMADSESGCKDSVKL